MKLIYTITLWFKGKLRQLSIPPPCVCGGEGGMCVCAHDVSELISHNRTQMGGGVRGSGRGAREKEGEGVERRGEGRGGGTCQFIKNLRTV